jgi:PhnB protein
VSDPVATSIAPWLSVPRAAEAADFYQRAFGAEARYRLEDDAGALMVARLAVDGAEFWLSEDAGVHPAAADGRPIRMILTAADPDAVFRRAVAAGATVVAEISEGYGWRIGRVADPFGHHWEIGRPLD